MNPFVVIGNLENRRVDFFRRAIVSAGYAPPLEVHYQEIIDDSFDWHRIPLGSMVRLDSPGENFSVERALIDRGSTHTVNLKEDYGRIRYTPEWFRGYGNLLRQIETKVKHKKVKWMNSPTAIMTMFDKLSCHRVFSEKLVKTPRLVGQLENYEQLRELMTEKRVKSVFIKPRSGSCAIGVIALTANKDKLSAYSTIALNGKKLYSSRRISHYQHEPRLATVVNLIAEQECIVEEWLPKAKVARNSKRCFDVRIVVINGSACHHVVRSSCSPMTNLHLGNKRDDPNLVEKLFGQDAWRKMQSEAEKASQAIGGHHYAGVDVMLHAITGEPFVIEINAYGDLIPNIEYKGLNTYEMEVQTYLLIANDK